jgi:crotonobetainyl-CoA:carnitine CoA-transferase CaiB-like acyl-CoA transferase
MAALDGLKIIDLTHMVAGPLCTMLLADLGADVIKIEPAHGDTSRHLGEAIAGQDTDYFLAYNRNKRSVVLDLKEAGDLALLRRMIDGADMVVENFRAGTMERLGIGYDRLRQSNPGLIYCSVSGYGPESEAAHRPAVDPVIQALSGIMQLTGSPESGPLKTGFPLGDYVAPLFATIGVLSALRERDRTGIGQRVDISMFEAMVFSLLPREGTFFAKGREPVLRGNAHGQMVPANSYVTADHRQIYVFIHSDKFWTTLTDMLDVEELRSPDFATNAMRIEHRETVDTLIAQAFAQHPLDYWNERIDRFAVPAGAIRTFREVFTDPLVRDQLMETMPHSSGEAVHLLRSPIRLNGALPAIRRPPPALGEHQDEIIEELMSSNLGRK